MQAWEMTLTGLHALGKPRGVRRHLCRRAAAPPRFCLLRSFRAGKDATEDFEEIGHSRAAKEMLSKYYKGEYAVSARLVRAGAVDWDGAKNTMVPTDDDLHITSKQAHRNNIEDMRLAAYLQGGAPSKAAKVKPAAASVAPGGGSTLASLVKALLPILVLLAALYYVQLQQQKTQ